MLLWCCGTWEAPGWAVTMVGLAPNNPPPAASFAGHYYRCRDTPVATVQASLSCGLKP